MRKETCYEVYAWSSLPRREYIEPLKLSTFLSHLVEMSSEDPEITFRVLKDEHRLCGGVPLYSFSTANVVSIDHMLNVHDFVFRAINTAFRHLKVQFEFRQLSDPRALKTALRSRLTGEISESNDVICISGEFENLFEEL